MSWELNLVLLIIVLMIFFLYYIEPKFIRQKLNNKNEHGSARWSSIGEIKKNFRKEDLNHLNKIGFPIYFDKFLNKVWFDDETPHWCYLGSSGSGKSSTSVIPLCSFLANAKTKRSVFVTDPKAEIFSKTSKMFENNGYKVLTVDFRCPEKSKKINLLEPCILEFDKHIQCENNIKRLEDEKDIIEKRKVIINSENEYIKNKINDILKEEPSFSKEDYLSYLDNDYSVLVDRLVEVCDEQFNQENLSMTHYAECNRLISSISSMITNDKESKDPFWNNSARNLLEGLIGLFLEDYKDNRITRDKITLTSIKKFQNSSMTEENTEVFKNYIESKPYGSKSKDSLLSIISSSENTYKSITSVFNEKMSLFDDVNVANITSSSDFPFDILGREKTVLYVIVPDEDKTYFSFVTILVGLIYKELVKLANEQEDKILPVQIDFLLDEFANCPPFLDPSIEKMVSVARSRGMRFHLYIQSFSQLDSIYGKEIAQSVLDNTGLCYLKTNTQETAEAISKRLGSKTLESNSINYSISLTNASGSKGTNLIGRYLLTADEVKQLHFKTIIFPTRGYPILRNTVFYKKFKCYKGGCVNREITHLQKLDNTYYTVDDIKAGKTRGFKITDNTTAEQKKKLEELIEKIRPEFDTVKNNVEYLTEENRVIVFVGFYNPLSENKIFNITRQIDEDLYEWNLKCNDNIEELYATQLEISLLLNGES